MSDVFLDELIEHFRKPMIVPGSRVRVDGCEGVVVDGPHAPMTCTIDYHVDHGDGEIVTYRVNDWAENPPVVELLDANG